MTRTDYLLGGESAPQLKTVEFNTIATGMGLLTDSLWSMREFLYGADGAGERPNCGHLYIESFCDAFNLWNELNSENSAFPPIFAMIVLPNERNIFEHQEICERLLKKGIQTHRITLSELGTSGSLTKDRYLIYKGCGFPCRDFVGLA